MTLRLNDLRFEVTPFLNSIKYLLNRSELFQSAILTGSFTHLESASQANDMDMILISDQKKKAQDFLDRLKLSIKIHFDFALITKDDLMRPLDLHNKAHLFWTANFSKQILLGQDHHFKFSANWDFHKFQSKKMKQKELEPVIQDPMLFNIRDLITLFSYLQYKKEPTEYFNKYELFNSYEPSSKLLEIVYERAKYIFHKYGILITKDVDKKDLVLLQKLSIMSDAVLKEVKDVY